MAKKKKAKKARAPKRRTKSRDKVLRPGIDVVKGPSNSKTHTSSGKFAKGNPGGPGNPEFRELHRTREALSVALRSFDPVHVFEVLKAAYIKATSERNVAAMRVFLEYTLGKPTVTLALKHEGGPMSQLLEYIDKSVSTREVIKAVEAEDVTDSKKKDNDDDAD
ncbi:hypothetical protein LCGC14_1036270 [marine sediment metagenome]|uniref:Uncharacterized protein n=1 Tax=marine sediment metagenome TaxID=412755 RepID=A0A0F9QZ88_9ZZZZ